MLFLTRHPCLNLTKIYPLNPQTPHVKAAVPNQDAGRCGSVCDLQRRVKVTTDGESNTARGRPAPPDARQKVMDAKEQLDDLLGCPAAVPQTAAEYGRVRETYALLNAFERHPVTRCIQVPATVLII